MQRQTPTSHTRKRTHLKPSQVAVLQESFVTNALPDAAKRSRLARALEVSERTVQIWFQNRRAKARKSEAYSLGQEMTCLVPNVRTGWIEPPKLKKPAVTPSVSASSSSLSSHRFRSASSRPNTKQFNHNGNVSPTCVITSRALSEGTDYHQGPSNLSIPVNSLRIGSWSRFMSLTSSNESDLVCYCQTLEKKLVWQVQEGGVKFRIEVDLNQISHIRLGQVWTTAPRQQQQQQAPSLSTSTSTSSSSSSSTTPPVGQSSLKAATVGQLQINVVCPHQVQFSMCQADKEDWIQCADFSEHTQVSVEPMHILQGNYDAFRHVFDDILTRLPELANKMVFLPSDGAALEPYSSSSPLHHPVRREVKLVNTEAPLSSSSSLYANSRSWFIDSIKPPSSTSILSFDEYIQFQQQQQSSLPMFI